MWKAGCGARGEQTQNAHASERWLRAARKRGWATACGCSVWPRRTTAIAECASISRFSSASVLPRSARACDAKSGNGCPPCAVCPGAAVAAANGPDRRLIARLLRTRSLRRRTGLLFDWTVGGLPKLKPEAAGACVGAWEEARRRGARREMAAQARALRLLPRGALLLFQKATTQQPPLSDSNSAAQQRSPGPRKQRF